MKLLRVVMAIAGAVLAHKALQRRGIDVLERVRELLGASSPAPVPSSTSTTNHDGIHYEHPSGDGYAVHDVHEAVDHDRQPGVPPEHNLDYQDLLDIELAGTFPASDPPSGW